MKQQWTKVFKAMGSLAAALSLAVAVATVNGTCFYAYHQPRVPAEMDRYKKLGRARVS
jgi:cyclic lactone autoinducer peptide